MRGEKGKASTQGKEKLTDVKRYSVWLRGRKGKEWGGRLKGS